MKKTVKAWAVLLQTSGDIVGVYQHEFKAQDDVKNSIRWLKPKAVPCTITYDDGKKGKLRRRVQDNGWNKYVYYENVRNGKKLKKGKRK